MGIPEQSLSVLIEEGLNLLSDKRKIEDSQSIYWYIRSKTALDRLRLSQDILDKFRYSLDIKVRVMILQSISELDLEH
ncbi:hypothetical protein DEAC_c17840 [Desulfosporosinus acididurans]|uniref:Uncharacterized protein n=1 Tax=Desulfosporosinus acididurans TaxID=476652 RepID=A0A0J1FSB5_9FIRM|nr:hypothetical protein [Desulfosporosinus acididurans]KLU66385.1 hypothetical protein DEAC_c17840 [Desulfosporosinus acididurans]